jgi:hypothetical protein
MAGPVEIEILEVRNGFRRATRGDLTEMNETPQALRDFDIHQVRRMELLAVSLRCNASGP